MTHSVSNLHEAQTVIVGVDTHKHMHVAVAILEGMPNLVSPAGMVETPRLQAKRRAW